MTSLVTITLGADSTVAWILATAALIGALILFVRWARNVSRVMHAAARVIERELGSETPGGEPLKETVQRELTNNHGSSMKDDLDGLTYGFRALARQVEDHLSDRRAHHPNERSIES